MRPIKREVWTYAILLIILFALAAVSVSQVIRYFDEHLPTEQFHVVAALVWLLTFGFMFLAGAFGIWTIQFVSEFEERRRLARLAEAMDHLKDGFYVLDGEGRIVGLNAAARRQVKEPSSEGMPFNQAFERLTPTALQQAVQSPELTEIEESWTDTDGVMRSYRIRSQPAGTLRFVMVSDVTTLNLQRSHSRTRARLQLLGDLARGVAFDFSSNLSAISGYASALSRLPRTSPDFENTIREIVRDADRGLALAEQLVALAGHETTSSLTDLVVEHARAGCDSLRDVLPVDWNVAFSGQGRFPAVALSGFQLEQLVINLGTLVADACRQPSTISVVLVPPDSDSAATDAGTLIVHGPTSVHEAVRLAFESNKTPVPGGAILSIVRSLVQDAGGSFNAATIEAVPCFRVGLPKGDIRTAPDPEALPPALAQRLADWRVLLALPHASPLRDRLVQMGVSVNSTTDLVSMLATIERDEAMDVLVVDQHLLRHEAVGLLRAIRKFRPKAGILVLSEAVETDGQATPPGVVYAHRHESPNALIRHMVAAYEMVSSAATGTSPEGGHYS